MRSYLGMLKISWVEHSTNEEVIRIIGTTKTLLLTIEKEELKFLKQNIDIWLREFNTYRSHWVAEREAEESRK